MSLEEADTDLETDRLLGQQRTDDTGFFDEKTVSFFIYSNNHFSYTLITPSGFIVFTQVAYFV